MSTKNTIQVPHLGGITASYRLSSPSLSPSKPTLILINSLCTTSTLFDAQFSSQPLNDALNLLAIEPLGHGNTCSPPDSDHFTYWDSAIMALQVMQGLGVQKGFALGVSQGGFIVARMALLAPDKITGILPIGTSMDYESPQSREMGCWDPATQVSPLLSLWSNGPNPDFAVDDTLCRMLCQAGFGASTTPEIMDVWGPLLNEIYGGESGRRKLRMSFVNLLERDGLLGRIGDVKCPVYWIQGTNDSVFSTALAEQHIKLFTSSPDASLTIVQGGEHFLNATNPQDAEAVILKMVSKYNS